ncbi:hypothetical protein SDC9_204904 [bioreactor metagenome]|uniref:Uncharacterized protein n=1 Tax=bioreactor metagenome TaxID=1076179 RepID=A0A645J211_9ZZZZ
MDIFKAQMTKLRQPESRGIQQCNAGFQSQIVYGVDKRHGLIHRKNLWKVRLDRHGGNFVPVPRLLQEIEPEKSYLRGMGIDAVVGKLLCLLQVEDIGSDILVGCVLGLDAH